MDFPFNALTEYFINENNIDIHKQYEIIDIDARKLIQYNRFDLMAKWIYIQAKENGISSNYGYNVYKDNINAFSCGTFIEPGMPEKTTFERYVEEIDTLIENIKKNGFDKTKSLIPVGKNDEAFDGSHRISVAAFFEKKVTIIRFPNMCRRYSYDYAFFRNYLMSDESMGYMAIQYAYLKRNCYMACLWPKADLSKCNEVEALIKTIGNIVYEQDVYLTYRGMKNFMIQIYGHQEWTGSIENHFDGVIAKVDACYQEGKPVRTYLFEADDFDNVVDIKKKIRDIFQIENHSIHISDNSNETIDMVNLLYNRNSVEFLNKAEPYKYSGVFKKLIELKNVVLLNNYDRDRLIIDSSAVLEVCGLREAADVDFLTDYESEIISLEGIDNHASQLKFYDISIKDLLYDPHNYFYFEGMKFVTPKNLIQMKMKRGEEKDIRDVKMLNSFLKKQLSIPKDYDYETIDKIRKYQIEHQAYGQGTWSYEQYRKQIWKDREVRLRNMVKLPLSFTYHYLIDRDFRSARKRERYIMRQRKRLENKDVSIISSNCNGGVISSDLGLQFKSPFVNLFIKASDYIKILSDLKGYMEEELHFVNEIDSIYGEVPYPTAYLRDAKIYFMHYASEEEARNAWNRRKKRINWENLYVIFTDRSGCTMDDLRAFDKLPYEHKVVFTHIPQPEIKSSFYIRGYEHENKVGILSDWQNASYPVKRVYDQFDYVKWFNEK